MPSPNKFAPALAKLGFTKPNAKIRPRLIMGIDGKPKSGKTRFALSMPGPIAFINFDRGLEHLLASANRDDIMLKDYTRMMPADGTWEQKAAEKVWDDFSKTFISALETGVKSLVVDTASEIWEILRWAAFGKLDHVKPHHYVKVNGPYRRLLNEAQHYNTNVMLLHKAKEEWIEDKAGQPHPTGLWFRDGFRGTSFAMELDAMMSRDDKGDRDFHMEVYACVESALVGQSFDNEEISFADVAAMVLPSVNPKEWK